MASREPVIEVIDNDMVEILRKKTTVERLEIAFSMWRSTRNMLISILSQKHPEWSEERITKEVARRMSHGAL